MPVSDAHVDAFYRYSTELRADWIQRWCPRGRVLEVGPSAGDLLEALQRRGYTVSGVDPNPASVRRVRERLGVDVELATIETSRQPDRAFDAVVHVDLMSHVDDPIAALRAMSRRLAPGGHLCFEVGLTGGVSPLWYRVSGRVGFPEHRWLYSHDALTRVIRRAGLRVVGERRFGLLPSFAWLAARRLSGPLAERIAGRPADPDGLPPRANLAHRFYQRIMLLLRYRAGRLAPPIGPQTLFVAARPEDGS